MTKVKWQITYVLNS